MTTTELVSQQLQKEQILDYLKLLNVHGYDDYNRYVAISCPLAPWRHLKTGGQDEHYSCCVYFNEPTDFYCFACHKAGTLVQLFQEYAFQSKTNLTEVIDRLKKQTEITRGERAQLVARSFGVSQKVRSLSQVAYTALRSYPSPFGDAAAYLESRGIEPEAVQRYDIRYDPADRRIVFPAYDKTHTLRGLVGRALDGQPKYKNYFGFNSEFTLGGENHVEGVVLVVEGFFDLLRTCLWASRASMSVVCSWGTNFSRSHLSTILSFDKDLVCCYDNDPSGERGWTKIKNMAVGQGIRVGRLTPKTDFGDLTEAEFNELITELKKQPQEKT